MAYVADVTTEENRGKGMGMIGAAVGLGFIFGPAIGGIFSATSNDPILDRRLFIALDCRVRFLFLTRVTSERKAFDRTSETAIAFLRPSHLWRAYICCS